MTQSRHIIFSWTEPSVDRVGYLEIKDCFVGEKGLVSYPFRCVDYRPRQSIAARNNKRKGGFVEKRHLLEDIKRSNAQYIS